ncbi:hypothetical protein ACWDZ4_34575 [Streptomyces sp. NPDC003016]
MTDRLGGPVSDPMNRAAVGKLAVFTMPDFSWNDRDDDRTRSGRPPGATGRRRRPAARRPSDHGEGARYVRVRLTSRTPVELNTTEEEVLGRGGRQWDRDGGRTRLGATGE